MIILMIDNSTNKEFKLIIKLKEYILSLEKVLVHIPNKDYYNKQAMREYVDNILYLVFLANTCEDKIYKKKIKYEIIAKLNMLNFYLERYYLLKYISKKEVMINSSKIEELTKMTYGWIKYDRK